MRPARRATVQTGLAPDSAAPDSTVRGFVVEDVEVVGQIEHCGASFVTALVDGDARRAVDDLDALDEALTSQHAAHMCHRHRVAGASPPVTIEVLPTTTGRDIYAENGWMGSA